MESRAFRQHRPGLRRRTSRTLLGSRSLVHDHARMCMNTQVKPQRQAALWDGRFDTRAADAALALSGSLESTSPSPSTTSRRAGHLLAELARLGVLDADGAEALDGALQAVAGGLAAGTFAWRPEHEDIHMNVEATVIDAIGPALGGACSRPAAAATRRS